METVATLTAALQALGQMAKLITDLREARDRERKQAADAVKALPLPTPPKG